MLGFNRSIPRNGDLIAKAFGLRLQLDLDIDLTLNLFDLSLEEPDLALQLPLGGAVPIAPFVPNFSDHLGEDITLSIVETVRLKRMSNSFIGRLPPHLLLIGRDDWRHHHGLLRRFRRNNKGWIIAVRGWLAHKHRTKERLMDDLAAELRLRRLEPPYGAVEQELVDRNAETEPG